MITLRQTIPQKPQRPRGETGKELISVRGLLEWAFGVEFASLEYDEVSAALYGRSFAGIGAEYRIMQQLALGKGRGEGVRVDTSFGTSHPHDDAEMVATVLRHTVRWSLAVQVAELSRSGRLPDWGAGARPRCEPAEWRRCKHGLYASTDRGDRWTFVSAGRVKRVEGRICPIVYRDTARELAARRRAYLDWWGALLSVKSGLNAVDLRRFEVTEAMPPMEPWKKSS
ncbi:MAG: hypothetical protein RIA08_09855 [Roseovarius sp.]|uniref:hypothetical protein n=1 Tax=Roseovarius sp. TaxID=1486281 RepID=UPI0032ED9C5D